MREPTSSRPESVSAICRAFGTRSVTTDSEKPDATPSSAAVGTASSAARSDAKQYRNMLSKLPSRMKLAQACWILLVRVNLHQGHQVGEFTFVLGARYRCCWPSPPLPRNWSRRSRRKMPPQQSRIPAEASRGLRQSASPSRLCRRGEWRPQGPYGGVGVGPDGLVVAG